MGVLTFRGGVHPYEGKELSAKKPIEKLDPGPELVYLMSQHIGAPAKPVVAVGDRVLRGQMIGEAGGFVSAPVYASVSGTVKEIGTRKTATGEPEPGGDFGENPESRRCRNGRCRIPDGCQAGAKGPVCD